ncbi:MAG: hypothetical protein HYZ48_03035 [Chlamydiales bacterium]|nr:hypothetical protein [Chlamydiales bacterium]
MLLVIIPILSEDIYMLCSDGLTDLISNPEISAILSDNISLEKMCKSLISSALEKGGNDNITVLLTKILS